MTSIVLVTVFSVVFLLVFYLIDPLSHSILLVFLICVLLSIRIRELYLLDDIHKKIVGKKSIYDYKNKDKRAIKFKERND